MRSAIIVAVAVAGAVSAGAQSGPRQVPAERQRAEQAVSRLTFGAKPGEVDQVLAIGVDRWIAMQLDPAGSDTATATKRLLGCALWTESIPLALAATSVPVQTQIADPKGGPMRTVILFTGGLTPVTLDSTLKNPTLGPMLFEADQIAAGRLTRAESSDQELLEVMTDFWENHFSLYAGKLPARGSLVEWDRAVIRPHALGRFRDLLGAVAHSPAMLTYLDNTQSMADPNHNTLAPRRTMRSIVLPPGLTLPSGINENYARELLELHTLGVDGGYTQQDVIEVARAFTGWTGLRTARDAPTFRFDSATHDADPKVVFGHALPGLRGEQDGNDVLDILAASPATARFIARKLVVRFVNDTAPASLVDRAAATYLRTDGDIREVLRTIVTSADFFATANSHAKIKTPTEYLLSVRRAMAAPPDTAAEMIDILIALGQTPFGHLTPEGWPDRADAWMNSGSLLARINLAERVATDSVPSIRIASWPGWTELAHQPATVQSAGVVARLLGSNVSAATRLAVDDAGGEPSTREDFAAQEARLRRMVAVALSSPEFQRR